MTAPSVCARCGNRPPNSHGWDHLVDPPRELWLCASCWDFERGRVALETLAAAGVDLSEIRQESDGDMMAFGRELRALWYSAPEELLLEMERTESAEQVQAFADYLREIGASTDQQPSPAVQAFLERHPIASE